MTSKKALLTGITGQDGSYLAELLLAKGYEVHGVIRRSSSFNTGRIDHLYRDPLLAPESRLFLHYGDLNDSSSLQKIIEETHPDEVYNLAAQSHVRVSFDIPEYTAEITALGAIRLLEALRRSDSKARFYQASSSELFGSAPAPQSEITPFQPRSPYAVAKAYAYYITKNYRESYGMFAVNGVLFNHECLSSTTPLIIRRGGSVEVCTAPDLVSLRRKGPNVQTFSPKNIEIWDGERWTELRAVTATKRRPENPDHRLITVQARAGVVDVTAHHHMLDHQREMLRADRVAVGSRVALAASFPPCPAWTVVSPEMAEFLGHMASEGYVPRERGTIQYTNNDDRLRARVAELWSKLFLGNSHEYLGVSGFDREVSVRQLNLSGLPSLCEWLRGQLYTDTGLKKVPPLVLNAPEYIQTAFLDGYYAGDGLKAGNGDAFKTNSAVLAQGLCWMYSLQGRSCSVYAQQQNGAVYYLVNLSSASPQGKTGQHLRKEPSEVRRIDDAIVSDEWVFDVETGSAMLCAGVGRVVVHNSPRRGETFVTRKITRAAGRIKMGLQKKLFLGNLDAKRDWGFAGDYVEAMWQMLQIETPEDLVIATGETHTVRDFLEQSFSVLDLDWKDYVEIDPRYFRPAEVDVLLGDASRARKVLGWKPTMTFAELVRQMVESDLDLARIEAGRSR